MRILLTGHHGYIGSVVGPMLHEAGHEVVGLDTFYYGGCDFGEYELPFEERHADIRDVTSEDLEGFEAVVHLAALSNDPLGDLDRELTYDINLRGTLHLAEQAKQAGSERFVFASSCSMYGAASGNDLLDESAPLRPLTPYAESKVRAEAGLSKLADDGFSPIHLRNATAYGASPRLRLDIVLNNLAGWAFTTGRIKILSDGMAWRPIVHIRDIGRAVLGALAAPRERVHDVAVNVGATSENYRVRQLAELVHEQLPDCEVAIAGGSYADPRSYRVDFTRNQQLLPGFEPEWTARAGAEELVHAYRERSLTFEEFESHRYTRLKQIKRLLHEGRLDESLRWRPRRREG
jgi:nucleoside-diphosphate-sugar epimerase